MDVVWRHLTETIMNHFFLSGDERLSAWKHLRTDLLTNEMSDGEHLAVLAEWWRPCPEVNRSLDPYDPKSWPTTWELLHDGNMCRSAIGLSMEQTLLMRNGRWNSNRVKLAVVNDKIDGVYMIPIVDKQWALNYEPGEITSVLSESFIENIQIIDIFTFNNGKHDIN